MNIQFDLILWICSIAEGVSLFSGGTPSGRTLSRGTFSGEAGNDVDLPW
jgi:hypothetical protein